jgi:hypothetical protein
MAENILIEEACFDIREGKLGKVTAAMNEVLESIKTKEPLIIFTTRISTRKARN